MVELVMVGLGVFMVAADQGEFGAMALWDLLALAYLGAGFVALRRSRAEDSPEYLLRTPTGFPGLRFNFLFSAMASAIGALAAIMTIVEKDDSDVKAVAGLAMICAWMLLHAGYARMYSAVDQKSGGLAFPGDQAPNRTDYMYFAFTVGASFAASDVSVTTRRMRWQVMVHGVASYFYNAAVVALAIGLLKS
ncbi:hypothetical protein BIV57_08500 [Mangrovactinospora gilvigrisea]|uniref:DUF1345 domain-containing protein n=1 Tax=Mangrovactinospora gilvigrisea TaxID=1428644 RepID=A0A1J7CDZ4_9ACTN|nr:hypothetical protein BIV57_08500 [Mangrovactinospora gilvigrisea]